MLKAANKKLVGIFLAVFFGLIIIQYQNCGSQQTGNGLSIGTKTSASSSPSGGIPGIPSAVLLTLSSTGTSGVAGSNFTFTASATGGTGIYSYAWNAGGGSANCASNIATCSVLFSNAGNYNVSVTVTDTSSPPQTSTASVSVTISAVLQALMASIAPTSDTALIGVQRTFTVTASGGQSPYTYAWTTLASQTICGATPSCTASYSIANTWPVQVTVRDAVGSVVTASANIIVTTPAQPPPPPPPVPVCPTSYGHIDSAVEDDSCNMTVTGWAWNPSWGQGTQVRVYGTLGENCTTTISQVRNDVHNSQSCVPAAPAGTPGFTCTFSYGVIYGTGAPVVQGYVMNPNGTVAATLNIVGPPGNPNCMQPIN